MELDDHSGSLRGRSVKSCTYRLAYFWHEVDEARCYDSFP